MKARTSCSVDGCDKPWVVKGLCRKHYRLLRPRTKCSVDGCLSGNHSLGLCENHYNYYRRHGEIRELVKYGRLDCSVEGCGRPRVTKGLCVAHYNRLFTKGSVDASTPIKNQRPHGSGSITKDGYKTVQRLGHPNASSSGAIQEHRLVVSTYLGRPLRHEESVHHRNGDRLDNSVGPCLLHNVCSCVGVRHNLELWHRGQPSGQRVLDKVRWAKGILEQYPELVGVL